MHRIPRFLLVSAMLPVTALLAPVPASAESGVTITVGSGVLLDPVLVRVPVDIACDPMEVSFDSGISELQQAVSKELIAHGNGAAETDIVCDGLPHANSYLFVADSSGPPFAKGSAVVTIRLRLCDPFFNCQEGTAGPMVIDIKRQHHSSGATA